MAFRVGLVLAALAVVLASATAGSGATKQVPSVQRGEVPSWALHGQGEWVKDNTPPPWRRLAETPTTCPGDPTKSPTAHGAAYVFYAIVKKIHIRVVLWKVHQVIVECHNGSYVTYFYRMRWPDIPPLPVIDHVFHINPWKFDGWVDAGYNCVSDDCVDSTPNQTFRIAITRGSFSACLVTKFLCIPGEQYGAVGQRIDGTGHYVKDTAHG